MYTCPKCRQLISTEVRRVIWHLREIHALSDGQDMTIICSQDGSPRPYHNFNSFAKHLHRDHQSTTTFMDNVTFQPNDHSLSDAYETETSRTVETSDYVPVQTAIPSETVASFVAKIYRSSNTTLMDVARGAR